HFRLLTGARGKVVMCVAVADRAGIDGSDSGSCEKLLGVRRELRATLRLDDWSVGGPQLVSWDIECDSILCVLLVVVLSRAVEPARFQFSQCAPEGVAYYATGSCVLYRLCSCAAFEAVEPCLSGAGLAWLL
ncbi:hypothetical protein Taro_030455, partial [Colocasia esculenta]|nr:hypothetical protein [Colocasia esculenta]